jgi:hypothetical protein
VSWWHVLQHWLAVHTGTVNEAGPFYGFFSGFGSDLGELTLIGGMLAVYRKHNCHVRHCPRIGKHQVDGTPYVVCFRHSPHGIPTHEDVLDAHRNQRGGGHDEAR